MVKEYNITCPHFGHEFTIDYSQWNSLSDLEDGIIFRYGPNAFSCKCPQCHKRPRYHVTENDIVGPGEEKEN